MLKWKLIIFSRIAIVDYVEKKDEMVYHIISIYSKQAQKKWKSKHDWVRKVIHWELYKRLNFDHNTK